MGADIKALRTRIHSVDSTLHLTKAMGLVASSKIRRANEAMNRGRSYAKAVSTVISRLTACPECSQSPYMRSSGAENQRTRLIVIAGDRGLCGGYNANIFRFMREYPNTEVISVGKRVCERYGKGYMSSEKFSRTDGYELAVRLCSEFRNGGFDRLGIVSTKYVSMMTQTAQITWVLPLSKEDSGVQSSILFEPDETEILNSAVPEYVSGMIMAAVRESFACEVAARRMAMDSAGKNANKMIADLTLSYNRARQGTITQEITEIVAGSGD